MPRRLFATLALVLGVLVAAPALVEAQDHHGPEGVIMKRSAHSVTETLDRLEAILEERGITVFARVDHAAGAESVGESLRDNQVLIFGNPQLGTPLMQANPIVGLDLPQKVQAFEDAEGLVWLNYNIAAYIADRHDVEGRDEVVEQIANALDALTSEAVK